MSTPGVDAKLRSLSETLLAMDQFRRDGLDY